MKACVLNSPRPIDERPLELTNVEKPTPGDDELLVRVSACGICRTDLHVFVVDLHSRPRQVIPGHQFVGELAAIGSRVDSFQHGQRVGIAWLHRTCGACRFCRAGSENLCEQAEFTGWTANGGFAEYLVAPAEFVYPLP